jgi:hypothetical protein
MRWHRPVAAKGEARCEAHSDIGGIDLHCIFIFGHEGPHRANGYEWGWPLRRSSR